MAFLSFQLFLISSSQCGSHRYLQTLSLGSLSLCTESSINVNGAFLLKDRIGRSQFEIPDEQVSAERMGVNGLRKQHTREMRCPGRSGSRHNGKTAALTAEPFQLHTIGAMDLIQPSMLNPEKIGEKQSKLELYSECRGTANGELSLKGMNAVIQQRSQNWRICLVNLPWKDSLGIEPLLTTKIVFKLPPLEF